ncbi:MAG TPA: hypothetical protein VF777_05210 [Phycisphaerales bacterium]
MIETGGYDGVDMNIGLGGIMNTLNASQLKAAWEDADGSASDLRKLLRKFVWTESETSVRIRDRRDSKA